MKIGFLRAESDEFVKDVISKLKDFEIKILSFRGDNLFPDPQCRVIIDRYSYDDDYLTEMMKTLSLGGAYVINNPFSANLANKVVDMKICDSLGIPRPKTFVLPLVKEDED